MGTQSSFLRLWPNFCEVSQVDIPRNAFLNDPPTSSTWGRGAFLTPVPALCLINSNRSSTDRSGCHQHPNTETHTEHDLMPTWQHCSGAETAAPCPCTLFDETTAPHINTDILLSCSMLFLTKSFLSTNAWFLVFTAHLFLPFLAPSYTISLYYTISKRSCHMTILGENEGKLVLQVWLLPRDVPAAKGTCSGSLCCSNPDTPRILC